MKKSLKSRILDYLEKKGEWVHKGDIGKLAEKAGYLSENAGRRCREMATGKTSSGEPCEIMLEKKVVKSSKSRVRSTWYKALYPQQRIVSYVDLPEGRKQIITYERNPNKPKSYT